MSEAQAVPACPLCEVPAPREIFVKRGYSHHVCPTCATIFVVVPDNEGRDTRSTCPEAEACHESSREHMRPYWQRALQAIGDGPLLDVGCGAGQFLRYASAQGWADLTGLEPDAIAIARARVETPAGLRQEDLAAADLPSAHFAGVTLWDVFEHVRTPHVLLARVYELLRPGGTLVIATYNRAGLTMRLRGPKAVSVMPPEHVLYPTGKGLKAVLVRQGFRVVQEQTFDLYLRDWLSDGPTVDEAEVYRARYGAAVASRMLRIARRCVNPVLGVTGLGDELMVIARKPRRTRR